MVELNYKHDKRKVMGVEMLCTDSRTNHDGIHVEFWTSTGMSQTEFAVRAVDASEGCVIGITKFSGADAASCAMNHYKDF